jgi:hypothetical protein
MIGGSAGLLGKDYEVNVGAHSGDGKKIHSEISAKTWRLLRRDLQKRLCRPLECNRATLYHWRHKFGFKFVETIQAPEDDDKYDVFHATSVIEPKEEIPFEL